MRAFDLSPLLRSTVGFDRFDRLFDTVSRFEEAATAYPPYNIEVHGEDKYRVTLAVAGFTDDELDIVVQDRSLIITGKGKVSDETPDGEVKYLHRGIARRAFERRFELADTIKVTGANLDNGLLQIDLVREVPEQMKPRKVQIQRTDAPATIESKAA